MKKLSSTLSKSLLISVSIGVLFVSPFSLAETQAQEASLAWFFSDDDQSTDAANDSVDAADEASQKLETSPTAPRSVQSLPTQQGVSETPDDEKLDSQRASLPSCTVTEDVHKITHEGIVACTSTENGPDQFLKQMTIRCLDMVKQKQAQIKSNPDVAFAIVKKCALPYIDQQRMGALALGHSWRSATVTQKRSFIKLFANKVMEDYQNAIAAYDNQYVEFKRLASRVWQSGQKIVKVYSTIKGGPSDIPVQYRVIRSKCSFGECWKVYDFVVNDISMVQSYNSQFKGIISSEGIAGLINKLQK